MVAAVPLLPGSFSDLIASIEQFADHPELKVPLYVIQGFATSIGLVAIPLLYTTVIDNTLGKEIAYGRTSLLVLVLTFGAVLSFIVVNSLFVEWNASVHLPGFLKGFEEWARSREEYAEELTRYLTYFDNPLQFVLAFVVIAVLPAFGEEYVFRGLLQNEFKRWTGNIHVAIWVSAILFSGIHMQFFGFIPRVLLGALFGYLYAWSGNLLLPVLAHFVNNGFSLVVMYLHQLGYIDMDVESTESEPWPIVLAFTAVTALLLYRLRKEVLRTEISSS